MIEVLSTGPLTLVEDLGRPGRASWGVSRSGAADRGALRLANRLVGNAEQAAALEVTLGGLRVRFHDDHVVALTGAEVPAELADVPVGPRAPLLARAGSELALGVPAAGLRTYVALRGGLDVPKVMGSRSTDVLSGLGPALVRSGDLLRVGRPTGPGPVVMSAPVVTSSTSGLLEVRLEAGVRRDWFEPDALELLAAEQFTVATDSNRVGVRLLGSPVRRRDRGEYPSEGLVRGAVQVPPNGLPIVFLADHPVTGGYPVAGVVPADDVDRMAQLRPGDGVALRLV